MANVLHSSMFSFSFSSASSQLTLAVPYKSAWLDGIGLAFFFLNLCLFIMNCILISLRFYWRPGSLVDSFTDQVESLFIAAIVSMPLVILLEACGLLTPPRLSRKSSAARKLLSPTISYPPQDGYDPHHHYPIRHPSRRDLAPQRRRSLLLALHRSERPRQRQSVPHSLVHPVSPFPPLPLTQQPLLNTPESSPSTQ